MTPEYSSVFANLISEICRPQHVPAVNPNAELITRLKNMAFDFDMAGQTIYWKTIMDTLEALGANND